MVNKNSLTFGYYLKAVRTEKGISLEEVSEKTRIRINNLLLIEKEDHDRLPSEVFVKGFLRAYAEAVGVDGSEVVSRYVSSLNAFKTNARSEADFARLSTRFWPHLLLSLGAMICIISLSVFAVSFFNKAPDTESPVSTNVGENGKKVKGIDKIAPVVDKGLEAKPDPALKQTQKSFLLSIITIETTWIKVIIDGKEQKEYSLKAGDRVELEALTGFNLLIGNAAGVQLILNDKPIKVLGKKGQVVNIQIP